MSDFFQNGIVTTLHELGGRSTADLQAEVSRLASSTPVGLMLPCLHSELAGPAPWCGTWPPCPGWARS
jgi:glucosyl-3-phosphoglycerate synthase